ncbi:MAG: arginine--tRNA ligase [Bacillales bacterium]|jgi:arginyl-tRNA synthetase|nr:arginine--tRNA ligase [Bacillales bacterium]
MDLKKLAAEHIYSKLADQLTFEEVLGLVEIPKITEHGDIAFPCFTFAKTMKKAPVVIASELAPTLAGDIFDNVQAVGPYVNFFFKKTYLANEVVHKVLTEKSHFGDLKIGNGRNITIDWSSPNIAKPFSLGHLRSTVIGNSIALIANKCDYKAIKINHLGDWGTQFGKLIVAYKKWGSEEAIKENPIPELLKLYVEFHEQAEQDDDLNQQGRDWFKRLENGDVEATRLWSWFREESLKSFNKIYDLLGMSAEYNQGESFYNDKLSEITDILDNSGLLEFDNGAQVVRLDEYNLPLALIRKSDGASLYITRDLATAIYRKQNFNFAKSIYAVGNEQTLHFNQLKGVLRKLGFDWAEEMIHTPFGLVKQNGKKLSTRKGKIVLLEEVLNESIKLAEKAIFEKNPNLDNKDEVAKQVGVGAVIFHDLKGDRMNEIDFNLENMLKFEGETGPYIQYTNARTNSILRKANFVETNDVITLDDQWSFEVVKSIADFPRIVERALEKYEPSVISRYLIDLSQSFNSYYGHVRILEEDAGLQSRLSLLKATSIVLTEGLRLLGIQAPKEM